MGDSLSSIVTTVAKYFDTGEWGYQSVYSIDMLYRWYLEALNFYFISSRLQQKEPECRLAEAGSKLHVNTDCTDHIDGTETGGCEHDGLQLNCLR